MDEYIVPDILEINRIKLGSLILDETYEKRHYEIKYEGKGKDINDYKLALLYVAGEYPYEEYYDIKTNKKYQTIYRYHVTTGRMLVDTDCVCLYEILFLCERARYYDSFGDTITKENALKLFDQFINENNASEMLYNKNQNTQDGENKDKQKILNK